MRTRPTRSAAVVAALVLLAITGSALAQGTGGSHAKGSSPPPRHAARSHAATRHHHARAAVSRTSSEDPSATEQRGENEPSSEADTDASAQAAACQKAGINPNADNVQYDDQTGTCSVDTGANSGP